MLDGPQALAALGRTQRASERDCRAQGKTPDHRPPAGQPYAGLVGASVALFEALARGGFTLSPAGLTGGVCACYPGAAWRRCQKKAVNGR